MADLTPEQQKLLDEFESLREALKSAGIDVEKFARRSVKSLADQMARLDKEVKKSGTNYKNAGEALASLKEAIEEDTKEYTTAKQKRAALDDVEKRARLGFVQNLEDAGLRIGGVLIAGYARYFINQGKATINGLMGNSSPFRLAADLQTAMYDDLSSTVHGVAGTVESAAAPMALLATTAGLASGGMAFLAAGLVTGAAKIVDWATSTYTDLQKFKVQKLAEGLDLLNKTFNASANAGAVFSGGMDEFKRLQTAAGVSQEQFAGIISRNSYNLADSGLGVTEATKLLSQTLGIFAKQVKDVNGNVIPGFREKMQNLGFDIEAQGDLAAEVMGMVKRAGRELIPAELAQETLDYAKNLRVIQEITGQDAKKRIAEAKATTEAFGFQTRFLKATGNNTLLLEQTTQHFGRYPKKLEFAIQQATRLGTVTDFDAIQAGYKDVAENIGAMIRSGNVNLAEFDRMVEDNLETFRTSGHEQELAMDQANSATGAYSGVIDALTEKLKISQALQGGGFARLQKEVDGASNTGSTFNKNINDANTALNDMKVALENDVTKALRKFSLDVPQLLLDAKQKLMDAGILAAPAPKPGQLFQKRANESTEDYNKRTYDLQQSQDILNKIGKAKGGISEGPNSGYNEVLHGTEAVVPLPDNRSIPVSLDSSSLTAAVHQQTSILSEILRAMGTNNTLTSQIVQNSY